MWKGDRRPATPEAAAALQERLQRGRRNKELDEGQPQKFSRPARYKLEDYLRERYGDTEMDCAI